MEDIELKELNKIIDNIAAIRIGMFTTQGSDGHLHSRPMFTLEIDDKDRLWFYSNRETLKLEDIEHRQQVNIAYSDVHTHAYVSISGKAYEVKDEKRKKELWDPAVEAWFPDGPDSHGIRLLVVEMESAAYWDTDNATMVTGINFMNGEKNND